MDHTKVKMTMSYEVMNQFPQTRSKRLLHHVRKLCLHAMMPVEAILGESGRHNSMRLLRGSETSRLSLSDRVDDLQRSLVRKLYCIDIARHISIRL